MSIINDALKKVQRNLETNNQNNTQPNVTSMNQDTSASPSPIDPKPLETASINPFTPQQNPELVPLESKPLHPVTPRDPMSMEAMKTKEFTGGPLPTPGKTVPVPKKSNFLKTVVYALFTSMALSAIGLVGVLLFLKKLPMPSTSSIPQILESIPNAVQKMPKTIQEAPIFIAKQEAPVSQSGIVLKGIMSMDGRNVALINDSIYESGDMVDGKKIVTITIDKVEILDGEQTTTLTVPK